MNLNLKTPLAFFDLETTGTNVIKDRIVEFSIFKLMPNGEQIIRTQLINPTIPIPEETSKIHGIYDADVAEKPTFKEIAKELAKFLEGTDLAGFNSIKFDVPLLVEEFLRADVSFDISKRKLIDVQRIFHMMEKRNLTAAYKFYCNKTLVNAHSAEADTQATLEIFEAQVRKYENMDVYDGLGNKIGVIKNDMETIHNITAGNMIDLAGRMILKDNDIYFNFGKHKGKKVTDVLDKEPSYYDWIMKSDFPLDTKRKLTEIKLQAFKQ
ncbi:MAG: 3'-5' exonuclease [Bacteroidetes bacterium]|nr:3'-5' exonuclease [Bacteroidota bacterium]